MKPRHIGLAMVIAVSFLAGALVPMVSSQSQASKYLEVDYMKVERGNNQDIAVQNNRV